MNTHQVQRKILNPEIELLGLFIYSLEFFYQMRLVYLALDNLFNNLTLSIVTDTAQFKQEIQFISKTIGNIFVSWVSF